MALRDFVLRRVQGFRLARDRRALPCGAGRFVRGPFLLCVAGRCKSQECRYPGAGRGGDEHGFIWTADVAARVALHGRAAYPAASVEHRSLPPSLVVPSAFLSLDQPSRLLAVRHDRARSLFCLWIVEREIGSYRSG